MTETDLPTLITIKRHGELVSKNYTHQVVVMEENNGLEVANWWSVHNHIVMDCVHLHLFPRDYVPLSYPHFIKSLKSNIKFKMFTCKLTDLSEWVRVYKFTTRIRMIYGKVLFSVMRVHLLTGVPCLMHLCYGGPYRMPCSWGSLHQSHGMMP